MTFTRARVARASLALAIAAPTVLAAPLSHAAGVFTNVYSFTGKADGATPNASVTVDLAGTIYGGAAQGGIACTVGTAYYNVGCGTIYKIDATGKQTTLFSFSGVNGVGPSTKLTLIGQGLYGGTQLGGKYGYGVLFGLHTDGTGFKILHNFSGKDGDYPIGQLIPVGNGEGLYGVTYKGGPGHNAHGHAHDGELFELMRDGRLVVLHAFNGKDGAEPSTLLKDQYGTLFGASFVGGIGCDLPNGCGTIYSYVPSTGQFTTLYQFTGKQYSLEPYLGSMDTAGNLYGATGSPSSGTIFELAAKSGGYIYQELFQFDYQTGGALSSGPILLPNGSLIGVTDGLGGSDSGVLYLLDPLVKPSFRILHSFPTYTPPNVFQTQAEAQPVAGPKGVLYGTTSTGGPACPISKGDPFQEGCGSVYEYQRVFSTGP